MAERAAHYVLPEGVAPGTVRSALEERFALEPGRRGVVDRTYFDTFDGLVRAAEMTLAWEDDRLVLADGDGRELATLERRSATEPVRTTDLAAGALRDRLAPVLDVRAATPLVSVRVRTQTLRVLDDERKTVARISVEQPSLALDGRRRADLRARAAAVAVRGYDKALRRVRRVLEDDLGLDVADDLLVDEAVARAGGTPGGFSSKLELSLEPAQRADAAAVEILTQLTAIVEANLPGTLADVDSEFLHDLRVAVRRTRALQRELKAVFPPARLDHFRREMRRLQQITGPSRDLDVYLLELDDLAGPVLEARPSELEPLRDLLTERRRRERRRMVRALRSQRTQTLLEEWRAFVEELPGLPEEDRLDAARPVAEVAARRIAKVYRRMVRLGEAIDEDSPPEALHALRKKGKELRYLLEFFAGLFPPATVRPMIKELKALQDVLGRHQDREVQAGTLRSLADEIAAREDGAAALLAMGVVVERLERQQADARARFAQRFARFAAPPRRAAVKDAFR